MKQRLIPKRFLGAFKKGHRKSAREFIDEELAFKLLDLAEKGDPEAIKALDWLTQFNNEYHKAVINKNDPNALHNSDKLRQECNQRSYATRNDVFYLVNRKKQGSEI
jgi:hypothetical protein